MIIFVIPFISEQNSEDWKLSTHLLQGTLDSIDNQSNDHFKIIVGCHEIPDVSLTKHPHKLHFVSMEYSPIEEWWKKNSQTDRMMKYCTALLSLKSEKFSYAMALDADDRLHYQLVDFLSKEPHIDGWIINKGFQVDYKLNRVFKYKKLSRICGSTFILSKKLLGIPKAYTTEDYQNCIYSQGHQTMEKYFVEQGFDLDFLPFYGVQYIVNHGLNDSDRWATNWKQKLKRIIKFQILGRKTSQQDMRNFGYLPKNNKKKF